MEWAVRSSFLLRYREYLNLPRVSQYLKKPISQLALLISQLALKCTISQKANISTCLANISTCLKQISQSISQTEPISQANISNHRNISNYTNISKVNISNITCYLKYPILCLCNHPRSFAQGVFASRIRTTRAV